MTRRSSAGSCWSIGPRRRLVPVTSRTQRLTRGRREPPLGLHAAQVVELIDGWFAPKTVRRGTRGGLRLLTGLRTRPSGLARGRKLSLSFGDRDKSLIGPSNLAFLFESPSEI